LLTLGMISPFSDPATAAGARKARVGGRGF